MQHAKSGRVENGSVDKGVAKLCIAIAEGTSTVNVVAIAPTEGLRFRGLKLQVSTRGQTRADQVKSLDKPVLRQDRNRQSTRSTGCDRKGWTAERKGIIGRGRCGYSHAERGRSRSGVIRVTGTNGRNLVGANREYRARE